MKLLYKLPLIVLFMFICGICSAADYSAIKNKKKYSLIDEQDEIYQQFDSYDKKYSDIHSIEPSGTFFLTGIDIPNFDIYSLPTAQELAGREFLEFLDRSVFPNFRYSTDRWQRRHLSETADDAAGISVIPAPDMIPPGITANLPFDSHLSLSGRKLIGIEYSARKYDKEEAGKRSNTSSLNMEQELQMRIFGRVGSRLDINVDYDDTADKRDISLVYKGEPDEFVQEAAFGDISVSLPTTEFMNYSKELFGLRVDTKYKNFNLGGFFSKTKGASEMKRFEGNTQLERKTIADTEYIRLKYFSIKDPANPSAAIRSGTAKVFIDYQRLDPNLNVSITPSTPLNFLRNPVSPGNEYTGNFVLLVAGQDYTIDYNTGIIMFRNQLLNNYVVAIDYQYMDNTWLSSGGLSPGIPLIIKDVNNTTDPLTGHTMELKTFYNLGALRIIRDNGRGNFILEIRDLNGNIPTIINPGSKPVPVYPSTINVDFENGVFNLVPVDGTPLGDDLYTLNNHSYNFITEFQYMVKILTLRPGIVPQSEKVVIDGRVLAANTDYIIDYDLGILTILNEDLILPTSVIDVTYDYSMFGSQAESTLIGTRADLNLTNNISIGGSFLYDFEAKGTVLPDIRNTPRSLMVGEGDVKVTDLKVDSLNMTVNAIAEYAVSSQNDNTSGKALIDSMDSSMYEDYASMIEDSWFPAATGNPTVQRNLNELSWRSYDMNLRDISPELEIIDGQRQLVMEVDYDVTTRSQVAMGQIISRAGYDFSKKLYIEVWIRGDGQGAKFAIDYASSINEDSDGSGVLSTEDTDGTGILTPWKDTGRPFHNVNGTISLIGAHNGLLDTEDLNGNGILDTFEDVAGGADITGSNTITDENGVAYNSISWTGWKRFKIPLDITSPENWRNIRILRLRIARNGAGQSGRIVIGKISIVGNKWEKQDNDPLNSVSSIGVSDPSYVSLLNNQYFRELYDINDSTRRDERALNLQFSSTITARSIYAGNALDLSKYESVRFFVFPKNVQPGDQIVFRAGGNDENYFEYRLTLTAADIGQWKLIKIDQPGIGRAAKWHSSDPAAVISSMGDPSLARVAQITVGVIPAVPLTSGEVWFNEIHVMGNKTIDGAAWKAGGNVRWTGTENIGAITFGADRKSINKDFQTITAGVYDRDYLEDNAYITFDGFKTQTMTLFPVRANLSKIKTVTYDIIDNNSNLISIKDEGTVAVYSGFGETSLDLGVDFPKLAAQYSRAVIDTTKIEQLEDRETVSGSLIYNNPLVFPLLPLSVTANAQLINSYYKVYPSSPITDGDSFLGLDAFRAYMDISDYHTLQQTEMFSIRLPFKFSKGIQFSPSYMIDKVREKNRDFPQEIDYDKALNQTVGASLVLGVVSWFSPTFTYSINTRENYDVTSSTNASNPIIPGQKKYIERSGIGEISWNMNAYDIAPTAYLKSLVFSAYYRLQDSDSYDNVDKDFQSTGFATDKLWIRDNNLLEILPSYSTGSYMVRSVFNRDDIRINGRYIPFEAFNLKGPLSPFNTLTANFTYSEGSESSYITGTTRDAYTKIWPDLLIGMSRIERFFGEVSWMSDTQMNFRYNNKSVTTYGVSRAEEILYGVDYRCKFLSKVDLYFALENTDISENDFDTDRTLLAGLAKRVVGQGAFDYGKWRFSLRYENENQWRTNADGRYASQVLRNSYLGQINSDLTFPSGIKIPVINRIIPLRNRIIFLSNIKYVTQESEANVEVDNNTNYGANLSADYEVSKHFRLTVGASYDRFVYTYNGDLNYTDLTFVSRLTIQF